MTSEAEVCGLGEEINEELLHSLSQPPPLEGIDIETPAASPFDFVVLLSIDGLRKDAVGTATPVMKSLMNRGVWAEDARTIGHSHTLPSHASMVSGVDIGVHGINFNAFRRGFGRIRFPTIFKIASLANLEVGMFVAKRKLELLDDTGGALDFQVGGMFCSKVVRSASNFIRSKKRGIAFVHFSEPDAAGHLYGWMSWRYRKAVTTADQCVGDLLSLIEQRVDQKRTLFIVTSDHGGFGKTHGAHRDENKRIPWIAYSPALGASVIARPISTMDTAATVLQALGLPQARRSEGHAVMELMGPKPSALSVAN
ncbi:MAG: alkaline phosphatase family protein [Myxococcales bacterium]|nr:MAG: alkaline phosphatase family protein [Myxococcales bacterium]